MPEPMNPRSCLLYLIPMLFAIACASPTPSADPARVQREPFGQTPEGTSVERITLINAHGMEVQAMTYGGIILRLRVPDRAGVPGDVVLGYDSLADYLAVNPYFGAIIGRYGNRIAGGQFSLEGHTYTLARNNGPNALHGGVKGFDKVVWAAETFQQSGAVGIRFTYTSPDGEEGYPGTLTATVTYTLTDANELIFDYEATTDQPTPVNLTQHSYFNLAGTGDILGHELMLAADEFTPVDSTLIPTGALQAVAGTPFDFTRPTAIGARIDADDAQLRAGGGYDHNFVLRPTADTLRLAARVYEPTSGRVLEIRTTEPGLQFYSGNFLDGTLTGKGGHLYQHRTGFCLETQHFPDAPNQPTFPSTILQPGQVYRSRSVYTFAVQP